MRILHEVGQLPQRVQKKIAVLPAGCWVWTACKLPSGYGKLWTGSKHDYSHRFVYERLVGPIGDGLEIDHLCRNPSCCNPDHLEPVTHRENALRSPINPLAVNAAKTHCKSGHEFTDENTLVQNGGRICRECKRIADRDRYENRRDYQREYQREWQRKRRAERRKS